MFNERDRPRVTTFGPIGMGKMHQQESELLEWIKSDGFVHESIAIADTVNGRGLVAREDIPANTVIVKVNRVGD